jgi:hypothetical protein
MRDAKFVHDVFWGRSAQRPRGAVAEDEHRETVVARAALAASWRSAHPALEEKPMAIFQTDRKIRANLDQLWAHRNFDGLREAGCLRSEAGIWELWEYRAAGGDLAAGIAPLEERVLVWTSKNRP